MRNRIKIQVIKDYMEKKNLTKEMFCVKCQISRKTYDKILSGQRNFNLITYFKIAALLDVDVFSIIEDD